MDRTIFFYILKNDFQGNFKTEGLPLKQAVEWFKHIVNYENKAVKIENFNEVKLYSFEPIKRINQPNFVLPFDFETYSNAENALLFSRAS